MPYTNVFQQVGYKASKTHSSILIHNFLTLTSKQTKYYGTCQVFLLKYICFDTQSLMSNVLY